MWKNPHVDTACRTYEPADGTPEDASAEIAPDAVPHKDLRHATCARMLQNGFNRIFPVEDLYLRAFLPRLGQGLLQQNPFGLRDSRPPHVDRQYIAVETRRVAARCGDHPLVIGARRKADQETLMRARRFLDAVLLQIPLQAGFD